MKDCNNVTDLVKRVNEFDDNETVNVKIPFVIKLFNVLYIELENDVQFSFFADKILNRIRSAKLLNRDYVSMRASEFKYLLEYVVDFDLERSMIVVTKRNKKKSRG